VGLFNVTAYCLCDTYPRRYYDHDILDGVMITSAVRVLSWVQEEEAIALVEAMLDANALELLVQVHTLNWTGPRTKDCIESTAAWCML
jgi:hypothetical protein